MGSQHKDSAASYARRVRSRRDVDLARIEDRLTTAYPTARNRLKVQMVGPVLGIIMTLFTVGAVPTIGPQGAIPGIRGTTGLSTRPMDSSLREILMPLSFLLGALGLVILILDWRRIRRHREGVAIVAALIALVADAAVLAWYLRGEGDDLLSFVLLCINAGLALTLLTLQIFFAHGSAEIARLVEIGDALKELPPDQRREVLGLRNEAIEVLVDPEKLDPRRGAQAQSASLGDLWKLDPRHHRKAQRLDKLQRRGKWQNSADPGSLKER